VRATGPAAHGRDAGTRYGGPASRNGTGIGRYVSRRADRVEAPCLDVHAPAGRRDLGQFSFCRNVLCYNELQFATTVYKSDGDAGFRQRFAVGMLQAGARSGWN
jgi:hypothetical protein